MKQLIDKINKLVSDVYGEELNYSPETEDLVECWQYDGGVDGDIITILPYTNKEKQESLRVDISFPNGDGVEFVGPISKWDNIYKEFKEYVS